MCKRSVKRMAAATTRYDSNESLGVTTRDDLDLLTYR